MSSADSMCCGSRRRGCFGYEYEVYAKMLQEGVGFRVQGNYGEPMQAPDTLSPLLLSEHLVRLMMGILEVRISGEQREASLTVMSSRFLARQMVLVEHTKP